MKKTFGVLAVGLLVSVSSWAGQNYEVKVSGMTCANCVRSVKAALAELPEVEPGSVVVNLKEKRASLKIKDGVQVPRDAIAKAIERIGYKVEAPAS